MSARTPAAAVNAYLETLQHAVSCVTNEVLGVSKGGYGPSPALHKLTFRRADPVPLPSTIGIGLWVEQHYRLTSGEGRNPWKVQTGAYYYRFSDSEDRELIAYHWHPRVSGASFPHLHLSYGLVRAELLDRAGLSAAHNGLRPDFAGAHLPTRRIALEDVLRTAIEQLGVEPRREHRRDWDTMLQNTRALFKEDRTWV